MPTQKFLDTFTDADGTLLAAHTPDIGGGVWSDVNSGTEVGLVEIRNNDAQNIDQVVSGDRYGFGWFVYNDGVIEFAVGDEIYCDFTSSNDIAGAVQAFMFCMLPNEDSLIAEHYAVGYQRIDAATVKILAQTAFVSATKILATGVAWATLTGLRVGVTIVSKTQFDVWLEPLGGGTRTAVASWTPDADYFDASHPNIGMQKAADFAPVTSPAIYDNLTVVRPNCFATDYSCLSADPATVTQIVPTDRIVLDDSCIPVGTLEAYN